VTLAYYALYRSCAADPEASGVVVLETETPDALLWDHTQKAWVYNPGAAHRILFKRKNSERIRSVSRAEAEGVTPGITGGELLPDEETIRWLFRWKGEPPGLDPL
jgi:hypothetical protein